MTDHAQTAVIEAMLMSWSDSPAGRKVTFLLPDDGEDHPFKHLKAGTKYGQRMAVSFALIDDDETETPVVQPEAAQATPADLPTDEPAESEEQSDTEIERLEAALSDKPGARLRYQLESQRPAERRQMTAANVAGMLTHDVRFQTFLDDVYSATWMKYTREGRDDATQADIVLKELTGVESKTQYDKPGSESERRWRAMHTEYDVWCRS